MIKTAVSHTHKLYIVFSSTPGKLGYTIRKVMGGTYNHVSVSFSPDIKKLYSFARIHENTPLYGGFVEESPLRYLRKGRSSQIKICELPITNKQLNQILQKIRLIRKSDLRPIYNLFSAITSPFHHNVGISGSYTCVEFVTELLRCINWISLPDSFISVSAMETLLTPFAVYEGSIIPFCRKATWGNDRFAQHRSRRFYAAKTTQNFSELTLRRLADSYLKHKSR